MLKQYVRSNCGFPFPGLTRSLYFTFLFWIFNIVSASAQTDSVTVRFANPVYSCTAKTICLDVEFQANAPGKELFGMNVRFFYDDAVLEFLSLTDFKGGYTVFGQNPPPKSTGGVSSGALFGFTGPMEFVNGAIQLTSKNTPIYLSASGWTKLFSVCFTVDDPEAFILNGEFCPSVVWDLRDYPLGGGFLPGDQGVVITCVDKSGARESVPVGEKVVHFNWVSAPSGTQAGHPVSMECVREFTSLELVCPEDKILYCDDHRNTALTGTAVLKDGPVAGAIITWSDVVTGNCADGYSVTRTWKATGECMKTSECVQHITVLPAPEPELTLPELPKSLTSGQAKDFLSAPDATYSNGMTGTCGISGSLPAVITPRWDREQGGTIEVSWSGNDDCGHALTAEITIPVVPGCLELEAFVFLEGALIVPGEINTFGTVMRTDLNKTGILPGQTYSDPALGTINYTPAGQPYSVAPWNYTGKEGEIFDSAGDPLKGQAGYAPTVVDWVLVSLRDKQDMTAKTICMAAGLLHGDGHIEFPGSGFPCCDADLSSEYCVVIEHRNHLIIMSEMLPVTNGKISCDLRTRQSYIDFSLGLGFYVGQKVFAPGSYAMYAGNGFQIIESDSDTDITVDDRTWWESHNGTIAKYLSGDYNLNGDCNMDDRIVWELNNGKFTSVPR